MINRALFTSQSEHWATPAQLYAALDAEFNFTLDPCPLDTDAGKRLRDESLAKIEALEHAGGSEC